MIRFLLDTGGDAPEEIALGDEVPADLTVLDWLRLHRHRTGTKEGCGSGDCGACTVVVASAADEVNGETDGEAGREAGGEEAGRVAGRGSDAGDGGPALVHESVNACIAFVGALHGRLLVTVESLARGGELHPVQRAMVEEHGSQCGFCTPGFVMSLYALYRAPDAPRVSFEREGDARGGGGAHDSGRVPEPVAPVDLEGATPVVAYRSASNADAARRTVGDGGADARDAGDAGDVGDAGEGERAGQADDQGWNGGRRTDGDSNGHAGEPSAPRPARPMTSPGGWLENVVTDDADALSHRIDRTLGGNLCRCTGYRPIKRAAVVALAERTRHARDDPEGARRARAERAIAARLREIAATPPAHPGFHAPDSLAGFADLVERHPEAPILGGGTDLALEVTQSLRDLPRLIHVARVPELHRVEERDGALTIGAAVPLTRCLALLGSRVPGAAELLLRFGSDPIRNRGTLGGNLGSASPIGDLPPLLLALDATLLLQRGDTVREHPVDGYFTGYRETVLAPGEFVRAVRLPLPGPDDLVRVYKVSKRMEDDISAVCGAFRLTFEASPGRRIVAARLAFGGMAATPARASAAEAALTGRVFDADVVEAAAAALAEDFTPLSDARASAGYRLQVARNLLRRACLEAGSAGVPVRLPFGGAAHAPVPGRDDGEEERRHGRR